MTDVILDKQEQDSFKQVLLDIEHETLLNKLFSSGAVYSHNKMSNSTKMVLGTDNFLQAVDIIGSHRDELRDTYSFDDFFSAQENGNDLCRQDNTLVVIGGYADKKELSERTGRDYIEEKDLLLEYIVSVANQEQ
jgi:hypothetical protein